LDFDLCLLTFDLRALRALCMRLLAMFAAGAAVTSMACLAPMCRRTRIDQGLTLSAEAGPTLFRSGGTVRDTSSWWGNRTVSLTYVGAQADVRAAYGFTPWLGADFTAGMNCGVLVNRPESLGFNLPGSWRLGLAALFQPWRSSLISVEYQLPHLFCLGWTQGFPFHNRELWDVTAQLGTVPFYVATHGADVGWREFVPDFTQFAVRRNFQLGQSTLAPTLGGSLMWNWDTFKPSLLNVMLGAVWSSPPVPRKSAAW